MKTSRAKNISCYKLCYNFNEGYIFSWQSIIMDSALPNSHQIGLHVCGVKVLSLLDARFDLISTSSMKIQIIGGKITENLRFKSLLKKVKISLSYFLFIFKFSLKNAYLCFLTIFEYHVL